MPRFYFHVFNGNGETHDDEGIELASVEEARAQAVTGIRSILRDEVTRGMLDLGGVLKVADEGQRVLFEIGFDEVIDIRSGPRPC